MHTDETILLADDNQDDIILIQTALHGCGVGGRVMTVQNGREAIDYLAGAGQYADRSAWPLPQVLLLDLKMPVVDGMGVLEWMRQRPEIRQQITTVVLTDFNDPALLARAEAAGAERAVVKPASLLGLEKLFLDLEAQGIFNK